MSDILKRGRVYNPRSAGDLRREVWKQFFGSDIETGYSYIYTWLANQFGHFMIGFAGTLLVGWAVTLAWPPALTSGRYWPALVISFGWLLVWICKELGYDIASGLRDLRFAGSQREALLANPPLKIRRARRFRPTRNDLRDVLAALREYYLIRRRQPPGAKEPVEDWFKYDIVRDSEIDGWFYLAGVLTALTMYLAAGLAMTWDRPRLAGLLPFLTFIGLLLLSSRLSAGWLWTNIAFDKAMLPFVGRFALNGQPPHEETRQGALDFATLREGQPGHLIIIGPPKSGRTTTAVALGVEALLQSSPPRNVVVYTTLCKLLDRVAEEQLQLPKYDQQGPPGKRPVWPPDEAELLIVDDIGAQGAEKTPLLNADAFKSELQKNDALRAICDDKRVVWVVGDNPKRLEDWMNALKIAFKEVGSPVEPRVESVELSITIPLDERMRPVA
jgi:hypothetical protein